MARIRTVKPEFWRHPVLGRLQDDYQLLALSLLTMADDEGYFRAEPALIRGDVQPFREDLGNISRGLTELLRVGWIEVGNHPSQGAIGFIVNFTKHQRVHNPTPSKLKGYFLGNISRVIPEDFPLEQGTGNMSGEGEHETQPRTKSVRSIHPKIEEVIQYCSERSNTVDPQQWYDYYLANGWKVGKNTMKDWKAAIRTWERNGHTNGGNANGSVHESPSERRARKNQEIADQYRRECANDDSKALF